MIYLFVYFLAYMMFIFPFVILLYVLGGLAYMKISKRFGYDKGWLGWIPVANSWLLGKLAISDTIGWVLVGLTLVNGIFNDGGLGGLLSLASGILSFVCYHRIYEKLSDKAVVMTVFTVLSGGILAPIFLFAIRNNEIK